MAAPKPDNPDQYRRFVETARELGADESPDAMDRAFERVVGPSSVSGEIVGRARTKLAEAERELAAAEERFDRYSGNNPKKYQAELRRLRVKVRNLKLLLED